MHHEIRLLRQSFGLPRNDVKRNMNILDEIIAHKKIEVEKSKEKLPIEKLQKLVKAGLKPASFSRALKSKIDKKEIALIAEVKKTSPSKGLIKANFNHIEIAKAYKNGGATCLSVLTDEKYFQGNLNYIKEIKNVIDLPILRKDFIIDPYQIYESIHNNVDCVLLIVGAFHEAPKCGKDIIQMLFDVSNEIGVDSLIEIHNEKEMEIALGTIAGAYCNTPILGINNRDLKTFQTNLDTTKNLVTKYKQDLKDKIIVSESGIFTNEDIKSLTEYGVCTFLVGESLMREKDIEAATKGLIGMT